MAACVMRTREIAALLPSSSRRASELGQRYPGSLYSLPAPVRNSIGTIRNNLNR